MERAWTKFFWPWCMWCPFSTLLCVHFSSVPQGQAYSLWKSYFLLKSPAFWVKQLQRRYRDSKRTRTFLAILTFISFLKMQLFQISDVLPKASIIPWQTILSSQPMKAVEYNINRICFLTWPFFNARPPLAVLYSSPEFYSFKVTSLPASFLSSSILPLSCRYQRSRAGAARHGSASGGGARSAPALIGDLI